MTTPAGSFVIHFWDFYCLEHRLVSFDSECLVDDGVCLCVLSRSRVPVFPSPPCSHWPYVDVQPCDGLGLACVFVVPDLLRLWGIAVLRVGEVSGQKFPSLL